MAIGHTLEEVGIPVEVGHTPEVGERSPGVAHDLAEGDHSLGLRDRWVGEFRIHDLQGLEGLEGGTLVADARRGFVGVEDLAVEEAVAAGSSAWVADLGADLVEEGLDPVWVLDRAEPREQRGLQVQEPLLALVVEGSSLQPSGSRRYEMK